MINLSIKYICWQEREEVTFLIIFWVPQYCISTLSKPTTFLNERPGFNSLERKEPENRRSFRWLLCPYILPFVLHNSHAEGEEQLRKFK